MAFIQKEPDTFPQVNVKLLSNENFHCAWFFTVYLLVWAYCSMNVMLGFIVHHLNGCRLPSTPKRAKELYLLFSGIL